MIPAKEIDVLSLIDTLDLYGLINDGINKYNDRNTVQGFINDMVGNTNIILGVHIVEETEGWFYGWADTYDEWNNYYYTPTEENE